MLSGDYKFLPLTVVSLTTLFSTAIAKLYNCFD